MRKCIFWFHKDLAVSTKKKSLAESCNILNARGLKLIIKDEDKEVENLTTMTDFEKQMRAYIEEGKKQGLFSPDFTYEEYEAELKKMVGPPVPCEVLRAECVANKRGQLNVEANLN